MTPTAARAAESQPRRGAAVTVIVGDEELLTHRAVREVIAAWLRGSPGVAEPRSGPDIHEVAGPDLALGDVAALTAPSLFGGDRLLVVRSADLAAVAVAAEIGSLAANLPDDVTLVLTHAGGARGKQLLASLAAAGARRIDCPPVRRFGERLDFLRAELAGAGRKADDGGLRGLLDAVGNDLRELAAACDQLAADTTGLITAQVVARYYRGRAEATGFTVADRAVEGDLAAALVQLRWALATGTSPVLISSALAQGIRALGRVGAAGRGRSPQALAAELGMPPWKVDRVRQQLRGWTAESVARAHAAVTTADADVKGEGASAAYALERAIRAIVSCRSGG